MVIKMKISGSEMKLMQLIWKNDREMTSQELIAELGSTWKPTTILTFLKRLTEKGILTSRKKGKTSYYKAAVTENEYKQEQTEEFINEIHNGSLNSLMSALCLGDKVSKDELEDIKKWFENI